MAKEKSGTKGTKKRQSSRGGESRAATSVEWPPLDLDRLDQAQELIFEAWEAGNHRARVAMAKKALDISPYCADAYVVLAVEAGEDLDEAIDLYRQGVEAGEKMLGEAAFRDDVGDFWGLLETRPYMRARHGLAMTLWEKGRHDEAVAHYRDMLRLNPNDNQGIRYLLLNGLLVLGRVQEAVDLLVEYDEDGSAEWAWSRALLAFRRGGDSPEARDALEDAVEGNDHVPALLLGRKKMPRDLPAFISLGDESEAVAYVHGGAEAWRAAPGALDWLAGKVPAAAGAPGDKSEEEAEIDTDKVDDLVLALLRLGLHDGQRVWKTFDWEAMNRLHDKGLISNPVGKAKSVQLTEAGDRRSEQLFRKLFARR